MKASIYVLFGVYFSWSIFSFTCVVDLIIALELDGYVKGFMEFFLREGEPYLKSSYGTMINCWDGTGHFAVYLTMIALLCSGKDYRYVGLYWVGSVGHSMIVYMPGNVTARTKEDLGKHVRVGFLCLVLATAMAMLKMVACMECKDWICRFYVTDIEPFLVDPAQYGRTKALCYFYFAIFYVAATCSHVYPGQYWVKDWSIIHTGAQLVFITCSLKWRTGSQYQVPDTVLAKTIFWLLNLSLVIVPHLHAMYCNRVELSEFISREITPRLFGKEETVASPPSKTGRIPERQRDGPS